MLSRVVLAIAVLAVVAVPASASGTHRCGALSGADGAVFHIRALGTSCSVARTVARAWYHQQQDADTESPVQDGRGRTFDCRIVRNSPGSDTAYPYSKIRCMRGGTVAAFWLRS